MPNALRRSTQENYEHVVRSLYRLSFNPNATEPNTPHYLTLTNEAQERWDAFVSEWGDVCFDLEGPLASDLRSAFVKLEVASARFALVHHCIKHILNANPRENADPDLQPVSSDSIEAGIECCRWASHEARRLYELFDESEDQARQNDLLAWIAKQSEPVTARKVQRTFTHFFNSSQDAQVALQRLVDQGAGEWSLPEPKNGAGRPPSPKFRLLNDVQNEVKL